MSAKLLGLVVQPLSFLMHSLQAFKRLEPESFDVHRLDSLGIQWNAVQNLLKY
jgi:hypothetical protein